MSPKKKPNVDITKVQFECDTSISLSPDTDHDHKTPSPKNSRKENRYKSHSRAENPGNQTIVETKKKSTSYEARQRNPNWTSLELCRTTSIITYRILDNKHQHAKQGGRRNNSKKGLENQIRIRKQGTSGIQKGGTNIKLEPFNFVQKGQLQVPNAVWKWSRRNGTKKRHRQLTTKLNLFQMRERIFSKSPPIVLGTK